jgi:hypothetical protein
VTLATWRSGIAPEQKIVGSSPARIKGFRGKYNDAVAKKISKKIVFLLRNMYVKALAQNAK